MTSWLAWGDATRSPAHNRRHRSAARPGNAALEDLRRQLGDDHALERFVADFLELLDGRVLLLGRLLEQGRTEESETVLLTLETSSHMVGADDLCARAAALRAAQQCDSRTDTTALYQDLVRASLSARELLSLG